MGDLQCWLENSYAEKKPQPNHIAVILTKEESIHAAQQTAGRPAIKHSPPVEGLCWVFTVLDNYYFRVVPKMQSLESRVCSDEHYGEQGVTILIGF